MIGILVRNLGMFEKWKRENKISSKEYVPITSFNSVIGRKFDEIWEVYNLPIPLEIIAIEDYLMTRDIPIKKIKKDK